MLPNQPGPAGTLAEARAAVSEIDRVAAALGPDATIGHADVHLERVRKLAEKYPATERCAQLLQEAEKAVGFARSRVRDAELSVHLDEANAALEDGRLEDAIVAANEVLAIVDGHDEATEVNDSLP